MQNHIKCTHEGLSIEDRQIFKCNVCNKGFTKTQSLKIHLSTVHMGEKNYKCKICGKDFPKSTALKRHDDTVHKGLKPYKCDFCTVSYGQSGDLKRHIQRVHKKESKSPGGFIPDSQLIW